VKSADLGLILLLGAVVVIAAIAAARLARLPHGPATRGFAEGIAWLGQPKKTSASA
jgi:hypothetical protein